MASNVGASERKTSVVYRIRASVYGAVLAGIWYMRNQKVFNKKDVPADTVCKELARDLMVRIRYLCTGFVLVLLIFLDLVCW